MAMAARGSHGTGGVDDDWFSDVDAPGALESDPPSAEDDWLVPPLPARARPELPWRRIVVVAVAAVVVLVAGLAAGGVFTGSSAPRRLVTPPVTVSPPTTTVVQVAHVTLPTSTLKPGDTGAQVRALQRSLAALGYQVGKVDGVYGPKTTSAVTAFQHAARLATDGIFGPKTLNALIHRAGP